MLWPALCIFCLYMFAQSTDLFDQLPSWVPVGRDSLGGAQDTTWFCTSISLCVCVCLCVRLCRLIYSFLNCMYSVCCFFSQLTSSVLQLCLVCNCCITFVYHMLLLATFWEKKIIYSFFLTCSVDLTLWSIAKMQLNRAFLLSVSRSNEPIVARTIRQRHFNCITRSSMAL